jgi:hypothetical protein
MNNRKCSILSLPKPQCYHFHFPSLEVKSRLNAGRVPLYGRSSKADHAEERRFYIPAQPNALGRVLFSSRTRCAGTRTWTAIAAPWLSRTAWHGDSTVASRLIVLNRARVPRRPLGIQNGVSATLSRETVSRGHPRVKVQQKLPSGR